MLDITADELSTEVRWVDYPHESLALFRGRCVARVVPSGEDAFSWLVFSTGGAAEGIAAAKAAVEREVSRG